MSDRWALGEESVYKVIHQFVQDGALVPIAGDHARRYRQEQIQLAIDVNEGDRFIATPPLIAPVPQIHFPRFDRVIVFIE